MKKKGFTLIELLAVIVILAIIALIAVPIVLNMIENARRSAAKSAAYGYIQAIDDNNELAGMRGNDMENIPNAISDATDKPVSEININIKGKKPTSGTVTIQNGKVTSAELCINNYVVEYNDNEATVDGTKCGGPPEPAAQPVSFADDDWSVIAANPTSSSYHVGDTKTVTINNNEYTLRIANNTTPASCNTEGFSQTACGLVIEFVNIVESRPMNTPSSTNAGGWKGSNLNTYLNGDFYDSLPSDLKAVIIPTYPIVSGSGSSNSSDNITETDTTKNKIYLFSTREVGFDTSWDKKSDTTTDTRTLDYYTTHSSNNDRKKYTIGNSGSNWWLRNAYSGNNWDFCTVDSSGSANYNSANDSWGVSPAFRIG